MIDASDFPSEGSNFNTSELLPDNVDFYLQNMGALQRKFGVRPEIHTPNMIPPNMQPNIADINVSNGMPSSDMSPDLPKSLKLPKSNMMPGADTEPGKMMSTNDAIAFQNRVMTNNRPPNPYFGPHVQQRSALEPITYFKDSAGNQYKTIGEALYVLGWQDADIKIRLVSEKTKKEIPTNGKKFQIYGWHLVNKMTDSEDISKVSKIDNIEDKLSAIRVENTTTPTVSSTVKNENEAIKTTSKEDAAVKNNRKNKIKKRLI